MMTATVDAVRENEVDTALWPIGAVAREVGLTPRAIRYYEEVGLLRPAFGSRARIACSTPATFSACARSSGCAR